MAQQPDDGAVTYTTSRQNPEWPADAAREKATFDDGTVDGTVVERVEPMLRGAFTEDNAPLATMN